MKTDSQPLKGEVEAGFEIIACPACNMVIARVPAWQPIETAPKDGTKVLLYTPECQETGWLAFVAESFYDKRGELNDIHVAQWQDGLEPTHWQPLPAPPALAERAEEGK